MRRKRVRSGRTPPRCERSGVHPTSGPPGHPGRDKRRPRPACPTAPPRRARGRESCPAGRAPRRACLVQRTRLRGLTPQSLGVLTGVSPSLFLAACRRRLSTYNALSADWYIACQSRPCRHAVMPMLNSTGTGSFAVRLRCSSASRTRLPTSRASRSSASGIATPNSSPPRRPHVSVARTARCSSAARTRIPSSPTWWPYVSLMSFRLSRSIIINARLHADRLGQLEPGPIANPHGARLKSKDLERLPEADLRDLADVQGPSERARYVVQPAQLALPRAVLAFRVVQITADEHGVQVLDHIAKPALGEQEDLVRVRALAQLVGDTRHHRGAY